MSQFEFVLIIYCMWSFCFLLLNITFISVGVWSASSHHSIAPCKFLLRACHVFARRPRSDHGSRTKCHRTKCHGQNVADKMLCGQNVIGQNVTDKMSRIKCRGQNVVDKMSWTTCHRQKVVDNMSWTKCHWQKVVDNMSWTKCRGQKVVDKMSWHGQNGMVEMFVDNMSWHGQNGMVKMFWSILWTNFSMNKFWVVNLSYSISLFPSRHQQYKAQPVEWMQCNV